jgi:hypothetical protein
MEQSSNTPREPSPEQTERVKEIAREIVPEISERLQRITDRVEGVSFAGIIRSGWNELGGEYYWDCWYYIQRSDGKKKRETMLTLVELTELEQDEEAVKKKMIFQVTTMAAFTVDKKAFIASDLFKISSLD